MVYDVDYLYLGILAFVKKISNLNMCICIVILYVVLSHIFIYCIMIDECNFKIIIIVIFVRPIFISFIFKLFNY